MDIFTYSQVSCLGSSLASLPIYRHILSPFYSGSEFHRVGAVAKIALVPTFVLTLGAKSRLELDDRSCLGCLAGVSSGYKYAGCLDESV